MSLNNLKNYEDIGNIRIYNPKRYRIRDRSNDKYGVFDSSHNISQILKFLPFYERLGLRVVNSKWNLSFYFSECWESLDYRFFDLTKHEFYLNNFKRFITRVKKLDICINQISDLNKLICSSLYPNLKCVDYSGDSNLPFGPNCDIDALDIIETDNEYFSDSDSNIIDSNSPDSSKIYSSIYYDKINFNHLKNILRILKNLDRLQISDRCNRNNDIFTRVNHTILKFIESRDRLKNYTNTQNSSEKLLNYRDMTCAGHIFGNFNSARSLDSEFELYELHTLIIDSPVDVHFVFNLVPFVKSIKNLVISRIHDNLSICPVISELLEHIPRNQLESLQIGRTIPNNSFKRVEFSTSAKARQVKRLNFAYKAFGTTDLDEGDEIVSILLSNHMDSLKIIILDDIELSLAAYSKLRSFKNLEYSKIYTWSNVSSLFPLEPV